MKGLKAGVAVLVVTAIAITAGAASGQTGPEPAWKTALDARSQALNQKHGLARTSQGSPAWMRALVLRSEALNRQYTLGAYAPGS